MGENSAISWTDHTFNPWWGCTKVGPGCFFCYAETFDKRVGGDHWGVGKARRLINDWSKPLKWDRKAAETGIRPWVFCASMADVFDNEVPAEWRVRLWDLIRETSHLNWILVTKRIGNVAKMVPADWPAAFNHVVLCITVTSQDEADRDVPKLRAIQARTRGISAEPLLGPIVFDLGGLDWIVVGGESGPNARPMHPEWARSIRDQCAAAGVAFHFKQWGQWHPDALLCTDMDGRCPPPKMKIGKAKSGRLLDGREHNGMPQVTPPPAVAPGFPESRSGGL